MSPEEGEGGEEGEDRKFDRTFFAVFKNQDDMPLWPECTNRAGLCSLGIYS